MYQSSYTFACDTLSLDLHREAIAEGADLNYRDKHGESPFDEMVWAADDAYFREEIEISEDFTEHYKNI